MSILVVDDEKDIRDSLSEMLKLAGYEVITAASGNEALECVKSENVCLMLVDLSMPGMSGEELINALWRQKQRLPVIAITALAPWQTAGLLGLGIGYIRKPVDAGLLLGAVKTLLRKEAANGYKNAC